MRKEVIQRLSDSSFMRKKRLRRLYPSDRKAWRRFAALTGLLLVEVILLMLVPGLNRDPAHSLIPGPHEVQSMVGGMVNPQEPPLYSNRSFGFGAIDPSGASTCESQVIGDGPKSAADGSVPEPEKAYVEAPPDHEQTVEVTLRRGDTLFDILMKEGIPPNQIHGLVKSARSIHNLGRMPQGRKFSLIYDSRDHRILHFETSIDGNHLLVVEAQGESMVARKESFDYEIRHRIVQGTINGSLFFSANKAGLPDLLILALAEIFGWDIDFNVDMRHGDSFRVLFEEKYLDGCFSRHGRILAAGIINRGRPFWAFYFEGEDGRSDYYDLEGRSLQKVFLKSPLKYTRISSRFSHKRFHPILKIYRPHLGVDYAAPTGTPVRAIGEGRITFAGWKGGFGRYVAIRHNGTHTSTYGHLHGFARGIRQGRHVQQGQIIGFVGSTGLSTGPHLDFRLLKNGRFINPLKVNYPTADPVRKEDRSVYFQMVRGRMGELDGGGTVLTRIIHEK